MAMTLDGNTIACDAYGCEVRDDFVGSLPDEDVKLRYAILGWTISGSGGDERHFCPDHAVPLVLVPIAGDQPYCASRCEVLGVGRVIGPAQRDAAVIRAAVRTVLDDSCYRDQARHMRDEIRSLPRAADAVTALERLVEGLYGCHN